MFRDGGSAYQVLPEQGHLWLLKSRLDLQSSSSTLYLQNLATASTLQFPLLVFYLYYHNHHLWLNLTSFYVAYC